MKKMLLLFSHVISLVTGFAAGIYLLPILTQPPAPSQVVLERAASESLYRGQFQREVKGSDPLHYGDGTFYISERAITFSGRLAPGPDYHLYLSPVFIETKADFLQKKAQMVQVGEVRTFNNFIVALPADIDAADFNSAIVWCETFSMFITAGRYQ